MKVNAFMQWLHLNVYVISDCIVMDGFNSRQRLHFFLTF